MVTTTKILGITVATTTVGLPVAGLVLAGGALTFGGYKVWKWMRANDPPDDPPVGVRSPKPSSDKPPPLKTNTKQPKTD
jgi:hypothetical protein